MFQINLKQLLGAMFIFAVVCAGARCSINLLQDDYTRVHPSEEAIADHIIRIGGGYGFDRRNERHIVSVYLSYTAASDDDLKRVLELPYLTTLHVDYSNITERSLGIIFKHPSITMIRVQGTSADGPELAALMKDPHCKIGRDE